MRSISAALVFIATALALAIAPAHAEDPYAVNGVAIDATAGNTFEAQASAMRQGQRAAAMRLIERLVLPEDLIASPITEITDSEVAELISGMEILDEQRSATRYLATLNISFDPRGVERLFQAYELDYVEVQARLAMVLPVLSEGGTDRLWGGHRWMQAFRETDFSASLTPFAPPPNDEGSAVLTARSALEMDEPGLRALAEYYGVNRIAVVRASPLPMPSAPPAYPNDPSGGEPVGRAIFQTELAARIAVFDRGPEMVIEDYGPTIALGGMPQVAQAFVRDQENAWKRDVIVRDGAQAELRVTVLYAGLGEWRALQEILARASLVEAARLDAMSRDGALMTLSYRGVQEQLTSELAERGAALEEHPGLGWVVRSTR